MSVPASYIGIILIWSTTPLAIKWSGEGGGFLFGVTSRMLLSAVLCSLIVLVLSRKLPLHRRARWTYVAAGLGIYGAMLSVYWGAQFIPSGLISVIFGLTPIITGLLAALFLGEQSLTPAKLLGVFLGLVGLAMIFMTDITLGEKAVYGIAATLLAMVFHSISTVWVKSLGAGLPALEVVTGGLLFSVPLYLLTWFILDGHIPDTLPVVTLGSILYLAVFGSVLGFILYFYVLRHIEASQAVLITLITPVLALLLGQGLNHEHIAPIVWLGTASIMLGMLIYQWGGRWLDRRQGVSP